MEYPVTYNPKTQTWITYSGEFNSFSEALKAVKGENNV